MKAPVSTRYAAKAVGISLMTLQRWIADGDIRPPQLKIVDGRATRLWDGNDLKGLKQLKDKIYCRGRGRKMGKKLKR
jgi:predicted site-specific integrase-resolvase